MSSIDITMTGAAGAAPTPAHAACPSLGAAVGGSTVLGGVVRMAPVAAPQNGTGLPLAGTGLPLAGTGLPLAGATAVRPRGPAGDSGISIDRQHSAVAVFGGYEPIAQRTPTSSSTTSSTPGDLPRRDPLS